MKKNAVKDILEPEETVLLKLQPDRKDYVLESCFKGLPLVLVWAGFDTFFILMMIRSGFFNEASFLVIGLIIGFFALHLIPVWLFIANLVKRIGGYKNVEYVFTDKRIILRSGIIGIDFKIIYYSEIASVDVKVGLWDRMFKVGDIHITYASGVAVLEDVHHPYEYSTKIQKIAQDIRSDMQYPNDLRPEENHGYNTKYKG